MAIGLITNGCDNEIDLIAPYKEIGVVYGLINPSDSIHYVRIQKAFLGEGNALTMAQVIDSTYYPDILDVQMLRIKDGSILSSIPLTRFVGPDKEEGVFPTTPNILYKTNGEQIYKDSEYKLVVKNTVSGHVFSAQSPMIDSMRIIRPAVASNNPINWANTAPVKVEFASAKDGKIYNLTIRFRYTEEEFGSGNLIQKHIDWVFPNTLVANPDEVITISREIDGEDFYKFVGNSIDVDPNVVRYAGTQDFIFTAGAEIFANYLAINQSVSSILTSIPQYSNVEGGTGIFSSRIIQVSPNKALDPAALNELKTGPYTSDLGFQ